jgi:hypothetical protein
MQADGDTEAPVATSPVQASTFAYRNIALPSTTAFSFVVVTENGARNADLIIGVLADARRDGDEIILLTRRGLGTRVRAILREVWRAFARRPGRLARILAPRQREFPAGTFWRLWVVGFAFMLGTTMGALFGAGNSAHRLD